MRAYLSLDGVLSYLEDAGTPLFNDIVLPSGIDKNILEECIYEDGAEFGVIYSDPPFFKSRVEGWFRRKYDTFQKWNDVLNSTYNPIENYDRIEDWTDTGTSTETGTRSDVGTSHVEGETHDNLQEQTSGTSHANGETSDNLQEQTSGTSHTKGETSGTSSNSATTSGRSQTDTTGTDTTKSTTTESGRSQTDTDTTDTLVKTNSEVTDQDGTSATRASAHNTSETTVSAFNDGNYQPSQKVATASGEFVTAGQPDKTDTTTTNDVTVTTNGQDTRTIDGQEVTTDSKTTTTNNEVEKVGQEITQTSGTTTESGTTSGTSEENGTTSGTREVIETGTSEENGTTSGTRAVIEQGTSETDGRTTLTSDTTGSKENEGVHSGRIHGNIGVVTTQKMIREEVQLRHDFNIYSMISDCFCDEFLIKVY